MSWIVDASVAVKWYCQEPGSAAAVAWLAASPPEAPELLLVEVANTFWRKVQKGQMTEASAQVALHDLPAVLARLIPATDLAPRALAIASALRHPVYDCLYLALAERSGTRVVTDDRRLLAVCQGTAWQGCVEGL